MEREVELLGQGLNLGLELALLKRRQLVEQRQNGNWVDGDHENLQSGSEHPEVVEELVAGLLDDSKESREDGGSQNEGQEDALDLIRDPELGCLLVETKLLLQNESVVEASRQREDLADDDERENEDDRLRDFTREARGRKADEKVAGP